MKSNIDLNSDAILLRKKFGEDSMSPIDVFSLMGNNNRLTLVFYPFSKQISGMCVRIGKDSLIAVNSTHSVGRQRYTAAHELYHLCFENDLANTVCETQFSDKKPVSEKEADLFASYFLAPYDALKYFIKDELKKTVPGHITSQDIVRIEQYFQMSRQATLYRLVNEGYISKEFAETNKHHVIQSAQKMGYDASLYLPPSKDNQYTTSGNYIKLVEKLNDNSMITTGKYEELLLDAFRTDIVYGLVEEVEDYD